MKKIITLATLLISAISFSQVGIGTVTPHASSMLDITSTTKGFLPPRMTNAEKTAISTPAAGLIVYCTDCGTNGEAQVYNGIRWSNMIGGTTAESAVSLAYVTIGTQKWQQNNLEVITYRNGDIIPQVTTNAEWSTLTTGAWCYYRNDTSLGPVYGKLYNFYAVKDPRGLAPTGWHIPTNAEWDTLTTTLGGRASAGNKMKSLGSYLENVYGLWIVTSTGDNQRGFSALPGGYRFASGGNGDIHITSNWWASDLSDTTFAWYRYCKDNLAAVVSTQNPLNSGYSVRCVKD